MTRKSRDSPTLEELSMRTSAATGLVSAETKRFDIFLIDTGWNEPVSKVVQSHLPTLYEYQTQDSLYVLTAKQSVDMLRCEPSLIGRDPTMLVYDLHAQRGQGAGKYRGFRIHL